MKFNRTENQLELFRLPDSRSVEKQIKRLENEISIAMRSSDFGRATNLSQEQKSLLTVQISETI